MGDSVQRPTLLTVLAVLVIIGGVFSCIAGIILIVGIGCFICCRSRKRYIWNNLVCSICWYWYSWSYWWDQSNGQQKRWCR